MNINHNSTIINKYFVIRFDGKEFQIKQKEKQRHTQDYNPPIDYDIIQIPSEKDKEKIIKELQKRLNKEGEQ